MANARIEKSATRATQASKMTRDQQREGDQQNFSAKDAKAEVAAPAAEQQLDKSPEEHANTVENKIANLKSNLHENAQQNASFLKQVTGKMKEVEKDVTKLRKTSEKKGDHKKAKGERKNTENGFIKPAKMSDALCEFLGVPHGSEMPRTTVNSRISQYVKENRLDYDDNLPRDKQDRRTFRLDTKLSKIFNTSLLPPDQKVGYFNMAKLINHNFPKQDKADGSR